MRFRHFASLDALLPATYRELHHKEAAVTIPRLGPGQDAAMPPKDRHGKTAQDYRAALIAELDAVPDYHRRKPPHSTLLLIWQLVPLALLWLNWPWVQRWLHSSPVAEPPLDVSEAQAPTPPPSTALPAPAPRQALAAPQPLDAHLKQGNVVDEEVLSCCYYDIPHAPEPASALQGMVSAAYLTRYEVERELALPPTFSTL